MTSTDTQALIEEARAASRADAWRHIEPLAAELARLRSVVAGVEALADEFERLTAIHASAHVIGEIHYREAARPSSFRSLRHQGAMMFLCAECDPCGGFFLSGGGCFGLESLGRCEGCGRSALCTDCHSGAPIRTPPLSDTRQEEAQ